MRGIEEVRYVDAARKAVWHPAGHPLYHPPHQGSRSRTHVHAERRRCRMVPHAEAAHRREGLGPLEPAGRDAQGSTALASLLACVGIALMVAQRSDYSVMGALLVGAGALPIAVRRVRVSPLLTAFVILLGLSSVWSVLPGASINAAVRFALIAGAAIVSAAAFEVNRLPRHLAFGAAMMIGVSILTGLAGLGFARDATDGLLQGVASHPNVLAYVCALCTLASIASIRAHATSALGVLSLVTALAGLVMTKSATAVIALLCGLGVMMAIGVLRRLEPGLRHAASTVMLIAVGIAAPLAALNFVVIAESVGRDPSLTGRTGIWAAVLEVLAENPLWGRGIGAVWIDPSPLSGELTRKIGFQVYHAHNGYLDVAVQVGAVGLALLLLPTLGALLRTWHAAAAGVLTSWAPAVLVMLLVYSMSEAVLLRYSGWFLIVFLISSWVPWGRRAAHGPDPRSCPGATGTTS